MKLSRELQKQNKTRAQKGDYDSVVALINHYIADTVDHLAITKSDHRFVQGALQSLSVLRDDIIGKDTK